MQKSSRTHKHDPERILKQFYELQWEKLIFERFLHVRAGKDHQDPKNSQKYCKLLKLY